MKKAYRNKYASVHWPAARNDQRPLFLRKTVCSLVNGPLRSSISFDSISFVRASEEMFRTIVLDALGTQDGCVLGEPTRRSPVLPNPGQPWCPPWQRPALTGMCSRLVLGSTGSSQGFNDIRHTKWDIG